MLIAGLVLAITGSNPSRGSLCLKQMWKQGKNEHGLDNYFIQNGSSTICKVWLNSLTYELWHNNKQYCGFKTSAEAKQKYDLLMKGV